MEIENKDILDKPIEGEFIWYDKDKMTYYYQNGTRIIGANSDTRSKGVMQYYWIRECRHKYYRDRYGDDYRTLFTHPIKYWSDKLTVRKEIGYEEDKN